MWTHLTTEVRAEITEQSTEQFSALWNGLDPGDQESIVGRAIAQARYQRHEDEFCVAMFPDRFEYGWSPLHLDLLGRASSKRFWRDRLAVRNRATAAPRSNAKSTLVSYADVVHDVCYGFERFVVIVSTTAALSEELVKDLYETFTSPDAYPDLHALYGPFKVKGGETAFVVRCPSGDPAGTRIWPTSVNGTIRGQKHAGIRPTRVILDDYEHPKRVLSPAQRDFGWSFLTKDVMKAGRRGTIYDIVGTVLHDDSVLARVLRRPEWVARKWKAMISPPTNEALWEKCRMIWAALDNPDRETDALAFYEANRAEMDAGAEVLWEEGRPLWVLMCAKWSDPAAFNSEDQNEPRDPSRMFFDVSAFVRCRWDARAKVVTPRRWDVTAGVWKDGDPIPLSGLRIGIWHDRAKGGATNDYPATAVVARDRAGYAYVLHVDLTREPTSGQRARIWRIWESFMGARSVRVGCDDTGQTEVFAGESWDRDREDRRKRGAIWNLNIESFTLSEEKNARINSQEPDAKNGWLQFASDLPSEVWDQYRDHPRATNDDAPDAIERADWLIRDSMPTISLPGRR